MRYTCIASKQTTGIKEEEYNIFVAGDSHNTAENSAILIYNNNDDYFSLAEDAKKEGANLMIVREYSSLNHQTTTLPSIHCYENIVNNLTEYVSQNESASITIELIREIDVTQDM